MLRGRWERRTAETTSNNDESRLTTHGVPNKAQQVQPHTQSAETLSGTTFSVLSSVPSDLVIVFHHGKFNIVWHQITRKPPLRRYISPTYEIRLGSVEDIYQQTPRFHAPKCDLDRIQRKGKRACVGERDWRSRQRKNVRCAHPNDPKPEARVTERFAEIEPRGLWVAIISDQCSPR